MLKIKNLIKRFSGIVAVDNLSLEVKAGEIYALIGPNGSGKTTTVKTATGLYMPTAGDVEINGFSIIKEPEKAKTFIGYVPDEPFVYERMSGREFLNLVGTIFGLPQKEREEKIEELLKIFNLSGIIDRFVENYSRGNKQKISILSALLHEPKILIIDEPIVGLDPESAAKTKEIFMDFAKKGGTVFVSTHTLSFVEAVADRIGLLKEGKLIKEGSSEELRQAAGKPQANLEELYLYFTKQ